MHITNTHGYDASSSNLTAKRCNSNFHNVIGTSYGCDINECIKQYMYKKKSLNQHQVLKHGPDVSYLLNFTRVFVCLSGSILYVLF